LYSFNPLNKIYSLLILNLPSLQLDSLNRVGVDLDLPFSDVTTLDIN